MVEHSSNRSHLLRIFCSLFAKLNVCMINWKIIIHKLYNHIMNLFVLYRVLLCLTRQLIQAIHYNNRIWLDYCFHDFPCEWQMFNLLVVDYPVIFLCSKTMNIYKFKHLILGFHFDSFQGPRRVYYSVFSNATRNK